uniref:Reactive oxygen species modulator 1 n=1 Tax=Erpetoichthys calabaricus TaxID=27687 RepID=A0A8C4X9Z8_ERPCA
MPVSVGPYGQTQPNCFDRVKMGFMMGFAVGMAAGAMFGTFSCLRTQQDYVGRPGTEHSPANGTLKLDCSTCVLGEVPFSLIRTFIRNKQWIA